MSTQPIAACSFLPWARQGLGLYIREEDQDESVKVRGSFSLGLEVAGEGLEGGKSTENVSKTVELYGPGDIIGISSRAFVRTEPRPETTNFESNYLPFVEFCDEDFPWRYTPVKPSDDGRRLRPWLALMVLEDNELDDSSGNGSDPQERPLPYVGVTAAAEKLPAFEELWAWAHVHVNCALDADRHDPEALAVRLEEKVRANPDLACSRLLCPRTLKADTGYHAFLIPSFETGRLAGLGLDPGDAPHATYSAWGPDYGDRGGAAGKDILLFPYYDSWRFRTTTVGDFEYLVRLLRPRTVDPRVGRREIDVQQPGSELSGIPDLAGVLRLGGALRAPLKTLRPDDLEEYRRSEEWDKLSQPGPHPFQKDLAALANLATDYQEMSAAAANAASGLGETVETDEDPWVVPPIYGRWHAETHRLDPRARDATGEPWVQELNLDPRYRVAAGCGTQVVQKNQESYMEAAWQQVGEVLKANERIRQAQMAKRVSQVWYRRELVVLRRLWPERFLAMAAPVRGLLADGLTVHHRVKHSALPAALTSKTMRQSLRPRARLARLAGFDAGRGPANLLERANRGEVSAAPPKIVAPALPTAERLAEELRPRALPSSWLKALERHPGLTYLPLALALTSVLLLLLWPVDPARVAAAGTLLLAGALWLRGWLVATLRQARAAAVLRPEARTPASVDHLPESPDFRFGEPGKGPLPTLGASDSPEATRFKESLRNLYAVDVAERALYRPPRKPLELGSLATAMITSLKPEHTIVPRLFASIFIPQRIREQMVENFGEVMVYPELDQPMYEPLREISSELFLPNIQRIENNSITLLETNPKFIESYMVGLNHELARELMWRDYPTDQRGSYFRQFWDVRGYLAETADDEEKLRERLRDVPELHRWRRGLGDHDHRKARGEKRKELVLVVRGELLKKFPTAVVYAHRAAWEQTSDGEIDRSRPRKMARPSAEQEGRLPRDLVKTPLYEAKVDPDIYFFGFDLTVEEARGEEEDPGWFFVIQERPGEPRFGLDLEPRTEVYTWSDLAWTDVLGEYEPGELLRVGAGDVELRGAEPQHDKEAKQQHKEDSHYHWQEDTDAAELAYILFQLPVLIAVHATEMLRTLE